MTPEEAEQVVEEARKAAREREGHKSNGQTEGLETFDLLVDRLARMPALAYDLVRDQHAQEIGVRVATLDKAVAKARKKLNPDDGDKQGRKLNLHEPEPWPQPVNGAQLLNEMSAAIRRYVVLSDDAADAAALWCLHTFLLDRFTISPRLAVTSPTKGCGKTTLLDVVSCIVDRPLSAANLTTSTAFRVIEACRPTLLVDEADTFLQANEELRGILNSGHRKGGAVIRAVGDDFEPRAFSTYSACAIALIGQLPETLHDRSVSIRLQRRRPDEEVHAFRLDRVGHLHALARKAARWSADHAVAIEASDPVIPDGIFNRLADNWRPLLAIADAAGGDWPQRARKAAEQGRVTAGDDDSRLAALLTDIRAIFTERDADRLSSLDLVEGLVAIEGRPWAEYGRTGKPLTQNKLAVFLKRIFIAPEGVRIGDRTPRGYHLHAFRDAFDRYLSPLGGFEPQQCNNPDEMGTSDIFQGATAESDVALRKHEKPNNDGIRCTVADENGGVQACQQCGHPGEVLHHAYGDAEAWLHRDCTDSWVVHQNADGLGIPDDLRRTKGQQ